MKTFEEWWEENEEDLWCEFHETGAYYEGDYDTWLEWKYDQVTSWDHDTHSGGGTDRLSNACGASHRSI